MSGLSSQQVRARRRAMMSWIPITIVALVCVGFVVGALAMQNSWWTQAAPPPSDDQQAADGASRFDRAGVDFLTRQGIVRIKANADGLPATELGLEADGKKTVEPLVPITAVVLGADGGFSLELVRAFTITTVDDRVASVELVPENTGTWLTVISQLRLLARDWGWTDAQVDQLQDDLTAASQSPGATTYAAETPPVEHKGARVHARVEVDTANPAVGWSITIDAID